MTSAVEAFAAVMGDVLAVRKTGHNSAQNFNFRGVDAVMNAVGPALRTHSVVITPRLLDKSYRDIEVGQKRTLMREVTVEVEYTVRGPEGDFFVGSAPGEAMDSGDKGTAKAMSVAYRTFLLQALTIPTDEPDPDEQTVQRAGRVEQETDAVACSDCGELVEGARSDKEPMRVHKVTEHGWVRNEDGTVAPPKVAESPAPSTSGTGSGEGGDASPSPAAATFDTHTALRAEVESLNADERKRLAAHMKHHAIPDFSKKDVLTEGQAESVYSLLDELHEARNKPSDLVARAEAQREKVGAAQGTDAKARAAGDA